VRSFARRAARQSRSSGDWEPAAGLYKVSDVIIDGVSMAMSERTEFTSLIQHSGGQVQGLLAMMRDGATIPASTPRADLPPGPGNTVPLR